MSFFPENTSPKPPYTAPPARRRAGFFVIKILYIKSVFSVMEDNGILGKVPGEYIAQAIESLPPAGTAEDRVYEVEIDAGHAGLIRLYARRQLARHGKHSHWFWSVYRAERI